MDIGIGTNADAEHFGLSQRFDKFNGMGETFGVGDEVVLSFGRITPQGNNVLDTGASEFVCDLQRFLTRGINACQMRRHRQARRLVQRFNRIPRQLARGAACTVGDRDKAWLKRGKGLNRVPKAK